MTPMDHHGDSHRTDTSLARFRELYLFSPIPETRRASALSHINSKSIPIVECHGLTPLLLSSLMRKLPGIVPSATVTPEAASPVDPVGTMS
jgi:hypothetical protein